jgi:hypothetical protein
MQKYHLEQTVKNTQINTGYLQRSDYGVFEEVAKDPMLFFV